MKARKLLMIVNPRAGKNKSRGPLFDAAAALSQAGYLLSIHMTAAPGDAAETAKREGGKYDLVVAVGGDGTLNEVVSGLVQLRRPPLLGYLPQGAPTTLPPAFIFPATRRRPPPPSPGTFPGFWTWASGTGGAFCTWPPSGPSPAPATPPPRTPKTP